MLLLYVALASNAKLACTGGSIQRGLLRILCQTLACNQGSALHRAGRDMQAIHQGGLLGHCKLHVLPIVKRQAYASRTGPCYVFHSYLTPTS